MKNNWIAFISGLIFAAGLCLSRMINPRVVINFLDVTGDWDPSLLFVMGGALVVSFISFRLISKRSNPVCDQKFYVPTSSVIDKPLIVGAVLFGIGWGMAGICPGPALAGLAFGIKQIYIFVLSMLVGMKLFSLTNRQ